MSKIHRGATLVPHFRDFLPSWIARQPWYLGASTPSLSLVGAVRLEDPAGEVGIETHFVSDGVAVYQIPMTYRGSPMTKSGDDGSEALIVTAEHSVLGTRWIYDGTADPVWRSQLLDLVRTNGVSDPSVKRGAGPVQVCGHLLRPHDLAPGSVTIELRRALTPGPLPDDPRAVGLVTGSWYPEGTGAPAVTGLLAVVREAATGPMETLHEGVE